MCIRDRYPLFHGSEIIFKGIAILIQWILQRMPVHFISNGFIVPPRELDVYKRQAVKRALPEVDIVVISDYGKGV